ncbi:helix-turn-helix domain-containing protein [Fibrella sp. HMF5036]|uniref:Helix-turn-helix domain-containing protein n=2 Tax=Fibrella aquatilis TaxID=2817059 RepID=A0A939GBC7_9BACT|nr:helix-turn-helix domain-containing protein [Fibrella aquatilis]
MAEIETYLQRVTQHGSFDLLTQAEADELQRLSLMAEAFEDSIPLMPIRVPETLPGMIQVKMAERQMKQKDMATFLDISAARFSEFMNGKRRITIDLAKKLYERLDISPEFILKKA